MSDNNTNNKESVKDNNNKEPNISAKEQIIDLKEEIKNLKIEIRNREARIIGMEEVLNKLLQGVEVRTSILYKQINKNLTQLADVFGAETVNNVNEQFTQLRNLDISEQKSLSNKFRQKEGLTPIFIPEEKV